MARLAPRFSNDADYGDAKEDLRFRGLGSIEAKGKQKLCKLAMQWHANRYMLLNLRDKDGRDRLMPFMLPTQGCCFDRNLSTSASGAQN